MAISIHLPAQTCLNTLLPVSGYTPTVFLPPSFLFSLESDCMGQRSEAIWLIPQTQNWKKVPRCHLSSRRLSKGLQESAVSHMFLHLLSQKGGGGGGSQSSKNGSSPTTQALLPTPNPALSHTLYFSVTNPGASPLKGWHAASSESTKDPEGGELTLHVATCRTSTMSISSWSTLAQPYLRGHRSKHNSEIQLLSSDAT